MAAALAEADDRSPQPFSNVFELIHITNMDIAHFCVHSNVSLLLTFKSLRLIGISCVAVGSLTGRGRCPSSFIPVIGVLCGWRPRKKDEGLSGRFTLRSGLKAVNPPSRRSVQVGVSESIRCTHWK